MTSTVKGKKTTWLEYDLPEKPKNGKLVGYTNPEYRVIKIVHPETKETLRGSNGSLVSFESFKSETDSLHELYNLEFGWEARELERQDQEHDLEVLVNLSDKMREIVKHGDKIASLLEA